MATKYVLLVDGIIDTSSEVLWKGIETVPPNAIRVDEVLRAADVLGRIKPKDATTGTMYIVYIKNRIFVSFPVRVKGDWNFYNGRVFYPATEVDYLRKV